MRKKIMPRTTGDMRTPYVIYPPLTKQSARELKAHIKANDLTLKWLQSFKPIEKVESRCKGFLGYKNLPDNYSLRWAKIMWIQTPKYDRK